MKDEIIIDIIGTAIVIAIGICTGFGLGVQSTRQHAVKANAAHYELDANQGRIFKWGPKP